MTKKLYIKQKIFNHLMVEGKKETCEIFFFKSSKLLQKSLTKNSTKIIKTGIVNSSPVVSVKQVKFKKGKNKNVKKYPFVLDSINRISLAIKFITDTVKKKEKNSHYLYNNLKHEIIANSQNDSKATKRKEELQKQTLLNKKYAYYRWF
jgi:ribosomal protein S7